MTVTVYRWDDASAPSLTHGAGNLLPILDAVLVNGYGAKPALGWSKPFGTSGNVSVYQQPVGTNRRYLRVDSSLTVGSFYAAGLQSYETMTDMDTGTGKIPTTGQITEGYVRWAVTRSPSNVSPYRWVIIGDTSWFFMVIECYSNNINDAPFHIDNAYVVTSFYGDVLEANGSDAYTTALMTNTLNSSGVYYTNPILINGYTNTTGNQSPFFFHRPLSQIGSGALAGQYSLPIISTSGLVRYPNNSGKLFFSPIVLIDAYSDATTLPKEYRGIVPCVQYPWHSYTDLKNATVYPLDILSDGVNPYLCIWVRSYIYGASVPIFLKLT